MIQSVNLGINELPQYEPINQGGQAPSARECHIFKSSSLLVLELVYLLPVQQQYKNKLFLHLVDILNVHSEFPLLVKFTFTDNQPTNLSFRFNYLLSKSHYNCNTSPIEQDNHHQERSLETLNLSLLCEWTDEIYKKLNDMVRSYQIRQSIYPKGYEMIEFLENSEQLEMKFVSLIQELIGATQGQEINYMARINNLQKEMTDIRN